MSRNIKPSSTTVLPPSHPAERHPEHRQFLIRSLSRNDADLAALADLNRSLHSVKNAIVKVCGEVTLLDLGLGKITLGPESDSLEGESLPEEGQELCVDFLLRMRLRRKLLNRLARRLNRLAAAMDGNDIAPPGPPRYGELRLNIDAESLQASHELWARQQEALKQVAEEREKTYKIESGWSWEDQMAHNLKYVSDDEKEAFFAEPPLPKEEPAFLSSNDVPMAEASAPLSDVAASEKAESTMTSEAIDYEALRSFNDAYEKSVDPTTGAVKYTILDLPFEEDHVKIKFGAGIGAMHRSMSAKEKEAEFMRWQTSLLARIPEQPTFSDLGLDTRVFFAEERRKRAEKEAEKTKKNEELEDIDEEEEEEEQEQTAREDVDKPQKADKEESLEDETKPDATAETKTEATKAEKGDDGATSGEAKASDAAASPPPKDDTIAMDFDAEETKQDKEEGEKVEGEKAEVEEQVMENKDESEKPEVEERAKEEEEKEEETNEAKRDDEKEKEEEDKIDDSSSDDSDDEEDDDKSTDGSDDEASKKEGKNEEPTSPEKDEKEKEDEEPVIKRVRPISLAAVPTFYEQDLKRIRLVHHDLVMSSMQDHARKRLEEVTKLYNSALRHSSELNARREKIEANLQRIMYETRNKWNDIKMQGQVALSNWHRERQQFEQDKLNKMLPSRLHKRPTGTQLTQQYYGRGDQVSQVVAVCLSDVIDAVEMVGEGKLPNPKYPVSKPDAQAKAEAYQRMEGQLRHELNNLTTKLRASEEDRNRAWKKMLKTKAEFDLPHITTNSYGQRGRVQVSANNYHLIPLPSLRQSMAENVPHELSAARPAIPSFTPARSPTAPSRGSSESRYSAARVRERVAADGTVAPVSMPKQSKDGLYLRPAGRTRKGMEWDAVRGIWVPSNHY